MIFNVEAGVFGDVRVDDDRVDLDVVTAGVELRWEVDVVRTLARMLEDSLCEQVPNWELHPSPHYISSHVRRRLSCKW